MIWKHAVGFKELTDNLGTKFFKDEIGEKASCAVSSIDHDFEISKRMVKVGWVVATSADESDKMVCINREKIESRCINDGLWMMGNG